MDNIISSKDNQHCKTIRKVYSQPKSQYLVENSKNIQTFCQYNSKFTVYLPLNLYDSCHQKYKFLDTTISDIYFVKDSVWENLIKVSDLQSAPDMIGIFNSHNTIKYADFDDYTNNILIIDEIQDPGNLGTIIRTAVAAGLNTIFIIKGSCSVFNTKLIRASAGYISFANIIFVDSEDIQDLKTKLLKKNYDLCIADSKTNSESIDIADITVNNNYALILGNEGHGVNEIWTMQDLCKETSNISKSKIKLIRVKMHEKIDSLNVFVASSLIIYKLQRLI